MYLITNTSYKKAMDISLVAKMKKYDEFISCYNEGDEKKVYKGKSLLFYSLSNNDTESRYLITDFYSIIKMALSNK